MEQMVSLCGINGIYVQKHLLSLKMPCISKWVSLGIPGETDFTLTQE